jgi:peptide/nickel transport system substrate-binding protein
MVGALEKEPNLVVTKAPGNSYQYIGLNLENPQLTRPVRQALAYAINREALIRYLWSDLVRPADSILPAQHWAHAPDLDSYPHDPQKARELLDAAGLAADADGVRLRIEMKTSTDQTGRELAAVLQDQLAQVGVALDIRSYEFATFLADVIKGNFDMYSLRWTGANEDPDFFEFAFGSGKFPPNGANRGHYSNPEVDRLIEAGRNTTDTELRRAAYVRVQRILNQDLPYIHLWYTDNIAVHNRRLSNIQLFPSGNFDFLTDIEAAPIAP